MRYCKMPYGGKSEEITYEEALKTVLESWNDCEMTRSMLTIGNNIQCKECLVMVTEDNGMCMMAGLYNVVPDEYWNRKDIEKAKYLI